MTFEPLSQDEFLALPPEKQLAYRRAVDALQRRQTDAPPLKPPPSTIDALRTECERHRRRIVEAMREGQHCFPCTDANFLDILKCKKTGLLLPQLARLWHAATVLDVKTAPLFPGEPQTGLEAVGAIDALLAAIDARPAVGVPSVVNGTSKERPALTPAEREVAVVYLSGGPRH